MQISRLFQILYILLQRRSTTAKALAEELEVSVRTIYRDIDSLAIAGIPVYTSQGRSGGIFIPENYTFSKAYVSDKEQDEILMALQSLPAASFLDAGETLSKLKSLFQKEHTDWVDVDFTHWGSNEKANEKFRFIKESILEGNLLHFQYANSQGDLSDRTVFPMKLLYKSRSWYLNGFDYSRKSCRIFKINRMIHLSAAENAEGAFPVPGEGRESAAPAPDLSLSSTSSSLSLPAIQSAQLTVRIEKSAVYRAYDEFEEDDIHLNDDGSYTVTAMVYEDNWLYSFLLSLGPDARVLSPPSIQKRLEDMARKTWEIYKKDQ